MDFVYSCLKLKGVISVDDLYVWKLLGEQNIASAHLTCDESKCNPVEYEKTVAELKDIFKQKNIKLTTIQLKFTEPPKIEVIIY